MDHRNPEVLNPVTRIKPWLRPTLSILVSVWILYKLLDRYGSIQEINIFSVLQSVLPIIFIIGLLTAILSASKKVQTLIAVYTTKTRLTKIIQNLLVSAALNSIAPGRLGDLFRMNLIVRTPSLTTSPLLIVIFERYLDIGAIFTLVALTSSFWTGQYHFTVSMISLFLVIMQIAILLLLSKRQYENRFLKSLSHLAQNGLEHKRLLIRSFGWSLLSWALNMGLLSMALHVCFPLVNFRIMLSAGAIGIAAGLFPIGLNGLGIREAALIFFFPTLNPTGVIKAGILYFAFVTIPMIIAGVATLLLTSMFKYRKKHYP